MLTDQPATPLTTHTKFDKNHHAKEMVLKLKKNCLSAELTSINNNGRQVRTRKHLVKCFLDENVLALLLVTTYNSKTMKAKLLSDNKNENVIKCAINIDKSSIKHSRKLTTSKNNKAISLANVFVIFVCIP